MKIKLFNRNTYIILAVDAGLLYFSYWLAYWLRFEKFDGSMASFFYPSVGPVVAVKLLVFIFFGLHAGMWRYTGVVDLLKIVRATVASFILIMAGLVYLYYPSFVGKISRSVFIIDAITTVGLISAFRLSIRLLYARMGDGAASWRTVAGLLTPGGDRKGGAVTVIYGADDRGESLLRSLLTRSGEQGRNYHVVGFLDDNPGRSGVAIHGRPVLGSFDDFADIAPRFNVREMLIASRIEGPRLQEVTTACRRMGIQCRVIPGYFDGRQTEINAEALRSIQIEDLLFRDPVKVCFEEIEQSLAGRRVLITGAGGSIGGQLALQVAAFGPAELILVDKGENYLHQLELELVRRELSVGQRFVCADITDAGKMERIFSRYRPEIVFHAAAHKHVPMMERNRDEAVRNNVGGMRVVAEMAEKHGAERFILISTDKAVDPVNIMGATKRLCELYLLARSRRSKTRFMAVRFGNVLGSNGSVVPLFLSQIERGGPVTVTHPDIERYFMTIHEAVLLILQAVTMGEQGELFLLDMGEPVLIRDLAEKMIELAGFRPYDEIDLVFTGLRPGEKLTEELSGTGESLTPTRHEKINRLASPAGVESGVEEKTADWLSRCGDDPDGVAEEIIGWLARERTARTAS